MLYPEEALEPFPDVQPIAFVTLGKTHPFHVAYSIVSLALLYEVSRMPGLSVVSNTDGKSNLYVRITITGHEDDLTSVNRLLTNAGPYDQAKLVGSIKSDMRPENLYNAGAWRLGKYARSVLLGHIERISREWEESGKMPSHFTRADYLANLHRLIQLNDLEATGTDLVSALNAEQGV